MSRSPSAAEAITTKDPRYLKLRQKLEDRWAVIDAEEAAMLLGITSNTVREYARDGRLPARKMTHGNSPWEFDVNGIRKEIGLPPLSDMIG